MRFTIERNWIDVIGKIWLPPVTCAMRYDLGRYELDNIGEPTRENVQHWLDCNAGDFQGVDDFHAVIGQTEIEWASEESECIFNDCMYGAEEDGVPC